jgi:hypothetical protein
VIPGIRIVVPHRDELPAWVGAGRSDSRDSSVDVWVADAAIHRCVGGRECLGGRTTLASPSTPACRRYGIPKALLKDSAQLVVEPAGGLAAAESVAPARVRVSEVADPHPISMPVPLEAYEATL